MPRPRNSQANNFRERNWSIVLHNFDTAGISKYDLEKFLQEKWQPRQYVIAQEAYNHQEGSHVHVFMTCKEAVWFSSILKELERYMRPERTQDDKMLRRVDVKSSKAKDLWHGCAYVMQNKNKTQKEKGYDESPIIVLDEKNAERVEVKPQAKENPVDYANRWILELFKSSLSDSRQADAHVKSYHREIFRRAWLKGLARQTRKINFLSIL